MIVSRNMIHAIADLSRWNDGCLRKTHRFTYSILLNNRSSQLCESLGVEVIFVLLIIHRSHRQFSLLGSLMVCVTWKEVSYEPTILRFCWYRSLDPHFPHLWYHNYECVFSFPFHRDKITQYLGCLIRCCHRSHTHQTVYHWWVKNSVYQEM